MTNQWKVDDSLGVLRIVDNDGEVIAEFWNPNHEEIARKMVAAEELIEALKAAQKKGSRWHPTDPVVQKINAAIAKATGA